MGFLRPLHIKYNHLLQDFWILSKQHAPLYHDNQLTLYIGANHVFHGQTKHVEINFHIIGEKIQADLFWLLPISLALQLLDIYTKAESFRIFEH